MNVACDYEAPMQMLTTEKYIAGRAVASLTVPSGREFHFPHFFLKVWLIFLIFPQTLLIFFLTLALRVGDSPTREGPGYATGDGWSGFDGLSIAFYKVCV